MSQENVEVVRSAHEAFNRDGPEAALTYWTDDVDHRSAEGSVDDRGPIHGKDALRAHVQGASGQTKLSGVETDLTSAVVYTIRDGKIAQGREYWNREEALEAAGLSE